MTPIQRIHGSRHQPRDNRHRIGVQGLAHLQELDNVDPAFSRFIFGHERLWPAEAGRDLGLRQIDTFPKLNEKLQQPLVTVGAA